MCACMYETAVTQDGQCSLNASNEWYTYLCHTHWQFARAAVVTVADRQSNLQSLKVFLSGKSCQSPGHTAGLNMWSLGNELKALTSQWWPLSTTTLTLFISSKDIYQLIGIIKANVAAFRNGDRYSRENIVDTDDAVRAGWAAVVYNGCITLNPDPATVLGQETVVFSCDLTFHQYYKTKRRGRNDSKLLIWGRKDK